MVEEEEEEEESLGKGEVKENEGEEGESFVQSVNAFNEVESERGRTEEQQGRPVTTVPLYCASVFVCVCVCVCVRECKQYSDEYKAYSCALCFVLARPSNASALARLTNPAPPRDGRLRRTAT